MSRHYTRVCIANALAERKNTLFLLFLYEWFTMILIFPSQLFYTHIVVYLFVIRNTASLCYTHTQTNDIIVTKMNDRCGLQIHGKYDSSFVAAFVYIFYSVFLVFLLLFGLRALFASRGSVSVALCVSCFFLYICYSVDVWLTSKSNVVYYLWATIIY